MFCFIPFLLMLHRTLVKAKFTCLAHFTLQAFSLALFCSLLTVATVPTYVLTPAIGRTPCIRISHLNIVFGANLLELQFFPVIASFLNQRAKGTFGATVTGTSAVRADLTRAVNNFRRALSHNTGNLNIYIGVYVLYSKNEFR